MAKLVYGLQQSLDGYVDHLEMRPHPLLFRHFIEHVRNLTGMVHGRRMYEVKRYWDEDLPDWDAAEHNYAAVVEPAEVGPVALVEVGRAQRHVRLSRKICPTTARLGGTVSVALPKRLPLR